MKQFIGTTLVVIVAFSTAIVHAQEGGDRAYITKAIQSYETAFNARDAKGLAAHWSEEGVYTSRLTGVQVVGREALEKEFTSLFAEVKDTKLELATESIEFVSPNVAIEQGEATVIQPESKPAKSGYSVVYVKREGKWLIDRVSEDEEPTAAPTHFEQLKDLEWIVGEWSDEGDGFAIEIVCQWTKNKNFISRTYVFSNEEGMESSGLQIISWDPKENQIRSWLFDSDGGVISGKWAKRDDRWIVQSVATLADGGSGSFTSIFRPLEDGTYAWQKINRVVDGRLLPNVDEIVMQRK